MTSYVWILLLASLVATKAQDFDLSDALGDDDAPPAKPTVKPAKPKNPSLDDLDLSDAFDLDPKKPVNPSKPKDDATNPKKPSGGDFDLLDAFGPDTEPKKPVVPPREGGTGGGGGSFDDKDLFDLSDGGSDYKPDKGKIGDGGGQPTYDHNDGADQPQVSSGPLAAIISSVGVALLGAASSYFAYQKKKLCFSAQGEPDLEGGKTRQSPQRQPEPNLLSSLLRSFTTQ